MLLIWSIHPNWGKMMNNGTSRGLLRNPRYELYAQGIAAGLSPGDAYLKAGFKGKNASVAARKIATRPEVQRRIEELLTNAARRSELSRKDILDRIFQDWELARKLGQVPAALKAAELMGKEMHRMFVERKEVGGPGDFDNKTEEELKAIIQEGLEELGWEKPSGPIN